LPEDWDTVVTRGQEGAEAKEMDRVMTVEA
jgi:hypothetical protein